MRKRVDPITASLIEARARLLTKLSPETLRLIGPDGILSGDSPLFEELRAKGIDAAAIEKLQAAIRRGEEIGRREPGGQRAVRLKENRAAVAALARRGIHNAEIARMLGLGRSYVGKLRREAEAEAKRK